MLKSVILHLIFLLAFSVFGQERELDSVCMNLMEQEFAQNQHTPKIIQFDSLKVKDNPKPGLNLIVEDDKDSYFVFQSGLLKSDTVTGPSKPGRITTQVWTGTDLVLGNRVVIRNNTDSGVIVPIEDHQIVLIQEALDPSGNWKPIEYFMHSGCAHSYAYFRIPAKQSYSFMIVKYCGEFKTKLRVRVSINHKMHLSEEFDGYVNYGQFEPSSWITNDGSSREQFFYSEGY